MPNIFHHIDFSNSEGAEKEARHEVSSAILQTKVDLAKLTQGTSVFGHQYNKNKI